MEVPRLGFESEQQPPACSRATAMPDLSHICKQRYTTAHGNARSLTHSARPGVKPPVYSLVRFITSEPQWELLSWSWLFDTSIMLNISAC